MENIRFPRLSGESLEAHSFQERLQTLLTAEMVAFSFARVRMRGACRHQSRTAVDRFDDLVMGPEERGQRPPVTCQVVDN